MRDALLAALRSISGLESGESPRYLATMSSSLLDQLIEPNIGCLTVEAAERLVALRADPDLQRRVDELADRANHGTPTIEEQGEYHRYLAAFHLVTLMQPRTRRFLSAA